MRKFTSVFLLWVLCTSIVLAQEERGFKLLSSLWQEKDLSGQILPRVNWHPYPDVNDRNVWQQIPQHQQELYIEKAESYLGHDWPVLPATVFLEFVRNGNRSNYEAISFERRKALSVLVFAELFENEGRFLDDITNLIWAICEETYWGIPAHVSAQKAGKGLPDVNEPTVDLFAAETGAMLSWIPYLIGDKLEEVSPLVCKRIHTEVNRRILVPNFERDDFWWMGFSGRKVNNWNPWVNSNWLACVLLEEQNEERRLQAINKIMRSLDQFIDGYPDDGGCDEGPNYWGRAGGALFIALELLDKASDGSINLSGEPLIRNMGQYIYKVYVGNGYFLNFADASARANPEPGLVYRYGKYIGDASMMDFGSYLAEQQNYGNKLISDAWGQFSRLLPALLEINELKKNVKAPLLSDIWYPQTQLMAARSVGGTTKGLYLAVKGGTNDESHNHNDVGSFMVYYDGMPVLIDIGVETYSAKTFSARRYDIWTMQSAYHNLPVINGEQQNAGPSYTARNVSHSRKKGSASISLDLVGAYPESANIDYWKRTMILRRGKNVELVDKFKLNTVTGPLELHFMTISDVDVSIPGKIVLKVKGKNNTHIPLVMHYNKAVFAVQVEDIEVADKRLQGAWGLEMHRILLKCKNPEKSGKFVVRLSK